MIIHQLRNAIWQAAKQNTDLIEKCKEGIMLQEGTPAYWEAVLRKVEEAVKPRKKRKAKTYVVPEWVQERYIKAYHDYQARNFPHWTKDKHTLDPKPIECDTNGLTAFIVRFLTWEGHFANRTGNQGTAIVKDGEIKRIPSSSKKGMQDIDTNLKHPAHPYGIPWKIEVKWAADVHRDNQKDFGKKVTATGGVYSVVRNHEDALNQYDALMVVQKELF